MRTLVRAVLQTLASSLLVQVLTALAGIFLARQLGPAGRGELAAALLWTPVFFTVLHLGLSHATQFLFAQISEAEQRTMFGNLVLAALAVGVPGALVAWWLMPSLLHSQPPLVVTLARIYALHLPMGLLADYSYSLLLATRRFGKVNTLRVLTPAVYLSGIGVLALTGHMQVLPLFAAQLLSGHTSFVYGLVQLHRAGLLTFRPNLSVLKRCLRYGAQTHLGTLCSLTSGQGDRMLMAAFLPSRDLGLYSVAVSTSMLPYPVVHAITTILLPTAAGEQESERRAMALRVARLSLPLLTVLYGGLFLAAGPLITLLYGTAYADAILSARILMLGTVAFGAADVLRQAIRALDKPTLSSMGDVAGLTSTVLLLAVLLPRYGFLGAAYASLGAYTVTYAALIIAAATRGGVRLSELLVADRHDFDLLWRALQRGRKRHDQTGASSDRNAAG